MTTTAEASSIIKRRRLVDAAAELFHRQGVAPTTFANVASEAKIALGSVYYYFNAKDDLVAAVTEARKGGIEALLARLDGSKQPRQRLEGLIDAWVSDRLVDALYGCPVGSLCFEVARGRGPLGEVAAQPFQVLMSWCERQFRQLGPSRDAAPHALHLDSALQGVSLTAAVLADAELITKEGKVLKRWLRSLEPK